MTNSDSQDFDSTSRPTDGSSGGERDSSPAKKNRSRSRRSRSRRQANDDSGVDATVGSNFGKPRQNEPAQPNSASETDIPDRYQSVGEVGRGGWGVVEKAIDRQLGREVAVKRFTDASDVTEHERQRFLHEAKVTSQLQHPGIVPVHEMGERREAFYVMKLLDGVTLREFIQQHHTKHTGRRKQTRFQFGESLEPLLQRFVDVCNAVAYAHKRGVVHRDLKPSNVMIGEFSETVLLDWGLAQSTDAPIHSCEGLSRENLHPTSAEVSSLIEPDGTVVGTPAFMSPEQAAGEISAISRPSDIYSLGVILYTIIAGRHPYHGLSVDQILEQVKDASYADLQTVRPLVPPQLVAIVQKAMSSAQDERYASADQLASDVRRFIAGDAVSVHRESFLQRSVRWCRHHQGIAASNAVSVSVLLIATLMFSVVIKHAHHAELVARVEAERSHREAILSLGEARNSADAWLIELSGSLQFYPGMADLRSELLERAIDQYDRIAAQNKAPARPIWLAITIWLLNHCCGLTPS